MNTPEKKYACTSPYLLWGCIISCTICTLVMIGGIIIMGDMNDEMSGKKGMHEMMMSKEGENIWGEKNDDAAMKMHCQEMPEMKGCEMYKDTDATTMDHSMMDMSDPMQMSMADMGKMLEGKTGDELDRAFLEGMIPHHQGAIDMAQYLEQSARPELQKLGQDIITAQQTEIAQMQNWLKEWNLAGTGALETQTGELTQ